MPRPSEPASGRRSAGDIRVAIAGGGTGGHTSAGLAVAAALVERGVTDLCWIGSRDGIEARRVPAAGLPFHAIPAGKLRRYWDWKNVTDLGARVPAGLIRSLGLLRRLRPDVLFITGGFVALPPALAARALGIPVVVHEQTAVPGLANRIAGRSARLIAVGFRGGDHGFPGSLVRVTGNPIRPELLGGGAEEGRRRFQLDASSPLVYITGGAQGSHRINRAVGAALPGLLRLTQLVHQCGDNPETRDREWLEAQAEALPAALRSRYRVVGYVGAELCHLYAAADLVIARSGAGTVTECCGLGRPALYIPLPGTSGDEQTVNARLIEAAGGAVVVTQAQLTPERLLETVERLLADREALRAMGERARALAVPDAAQRIAALVLEAGGA